MLCVYGPTGPAHGQCFVVVLDDVVVAVVVAADDDDADDVLSVASVTSVYPVVSVGPGAITQP